MWESTWLWSQIPKTKAHNSCEDDDALSLSSDSQMLAPTDNSIA